MPEPMSLLPDDPAEVGPYRLEGRLGAGGQGTVYTARGPGSALVAVKLLHSHLIADDEARNRFLREVQTAKRVAPFCTAQLLDSGFAGVRPYIVSEYVDGPSLQDSVRESGPRGAAALQRLAINTATALAAIHAAGVVHRDFKPGNVLLGPDGPVVIDFGIAKALDLSQSVVSSQPIGSPAYMAPEQIADEDVGPAADLFAWAATMYYAATGRRAFPGDSIPATLHSVLRSEPDLGGVEGRLRRLLEECLAKDQALRPTAAQVVERLRALPAPTWQSVPPSGLAGSPAPAEPAGSFSPAGYSDPLGHGGHGGHGAHTGPGGHLVSGQVPVQDTLAGNRAHRRGLALGAASAALIVAAGAGIGVYALAPATAQRQTAQQAPSASAPPSPPASTPSPEPTAYELLATKKPAKTTDPTPASPTRTPRKSASPTRDTDSTPGSSPTASTKKPRTTPKPTRTSPTTSRPPSPKPSLQPSTGTVTWNDASAYCTAQGQTIMYSAGWSGMKCSGGREFSVSELCAWKYPGYEQAVGVPPENPWLLTATCNLS
ncbi:serine/threonine protein kinase [Nonomuraea gerenzanensis]|uniref:Tyrosine protein kinase:Serine/threonine protein kinase n=1 Tax=Nonomuraea gerenzanensis TaxID=93944 RepID=A0A1M4DVT2_9ACTN|nr:serine/threonine-protein kinase [Nonomuraea gerenzanensis]UBU13034.1 protein kinase [Nonomuraea gerenzanensis]SBO90676.1 Tyrosine protein kinase:Serine/threonine protein kinase [Nonomuraea gerenzanensis]